MEVELPEKLQFLFDEARYKCAHGGRGSAKSWSFARALLIKGRMKPLRILCARELQKSIKDSVHKLLNDQIQAMGLGSFYEVLDAEIRGKNGTEIVFSGLAQHTVESIKSFEGCDICWVEEAQFVSRRSWQVLTPTIRKAGSEIWISLNPEMETDETFQRFVRNPPPRSVVVEVNYHDNPWFTAELEEERLHCLKTDPEGYKNIWEGKCKPAVEGAIFYNEISASESQGRICHVPYDPLLKVHGIWDLGWNDAMTVILVQKSASALMVVDYIEDSHRTYADYSADLKERKFNWGKMFLPHDAKHGNPQTGKSPKQVLEALGWDCQMTDNVAIEEGIRQARLTFQRVYFDRDKSARLVECLKRYRRQINRATEEPGAPLHDAFSHGADAFRYLCLNAEKITNETQWGGPLKYGKSGVV